MFIFYCLTTLNQNFVLDHILTIWKIKEHEQLDHILTIWKIKEHEQE